MVSLASRESALEVSRAIPAKKVLVAAQPGDACARLKARLAEEGIEVHGLELAHIGGVGEAFSVRPQRGFAGLHVPVARFNATGTRGGQCELSWSTTVKGIIPTVWIILQWFVLGGVVRGLLNDWLGVDAAVAGWTAIATIVGGLLLQLRDARRTAARLPAFEEQISQCVRESAGESLRLEGGAKEAATGQLSMSMADESGALSTRGDGS